MKQATHGLLLLLLLAGCTPTNQALDTACNANGCISLSKFSANLDAALKNQTVGYISTVGALAIISKSGNARTAADAPSRAMDVELPTNVASLSKVITTVGVLQSLAKHNRTIDDKIAPFLPPDWTKGPNIDTITFKQLLTHSAGFRETDNSYGGLKQQIADGVKLTDKTPLYDNTNFAIFRVLLPFMEGFSDPGPATRDTATSKFYVDYIRQHVLNPVNVTDADCKPPSGTQKILSYPLPAGSAHGTDWGDWTGVCGGGGWVMTAGDLYRFLLSLTSGNTLLSDAQKKMMNDNCLGWDCSVQVQNDFRGKNGILLGTPNKVWLYTFFGIFKENVPVVVVVNSDTPNSANITSVVVKAFQDAAVPHP
jgi:CubicO group peptidase (beta-lactamase class C family)